LSDEEAAAMVHAVSASLDVFTRVEELDEPSVPLKHQHRDPGHTPVAGEDPYNAFIRFCRVVGAGSGPLQCKTVGVKDCTAVAGVPMTNGGRRTPVVVPTEDAVVVERLLDAGAIITGKTNLEDLALGLGEGSAFGAARNPIDPRLTTGGSSSGSGAAVAAGQVVLALGADEGGSVRIPAAWCGLIGEVAARIQRRGTSTRLPRGVVRVIFGVVLVWIGHRPRSLPAFESFPSAQQRRNGPAISA
jgi:amidase